MRGLYIARLDLDAPHAAGVAKKIFAQQKVLSTQLGTTSLIHTSANGIVLDGDIVYSCKADSWSHRMQHMVHFHPETAKVVERTKPGFCYIRYQRSDPGFISMLKRFRKVNSDLAIVIEFPSYPYHTEYRTLREQAWGLIDRATRKSMKGLVDRFVTFTRQPDILGVPTIGTSNGVDVASTPLLTPPSDSSIIRLIGLANLSFWHGYDRVIAGLAQHSSDNVVFDIIGTGMELPRLQADVKRRNLEEKVRFLGPLHGQALHHALEGACIGVASLGLHRMKFGGIPLKAREYCAQGLPFVIGYPDPDFEQEFPYKFTVSSDDSPVDIESIVSFYERLRDEVPSYNLHMRQYAEQHLTWDRKLQPVLREIADRMGRVHT